MYVVQPAASKPGNGGNVNRSLWNHITVASFHLESPKLLKKNPSYYFFRDFVSPLAK